jgi:hypothetical protein
VAAMARKICVVMLAFLLLAVACFPAVSKAHYSSSLLVSPMPIPFQLTECSLIHQYHSSFSDEVLQEAKGGSVPVPGGGNLKPWGTDPAAGCLTGRSADALCSETSLLLFCRVLGEVLGAVRQDAVQQGVPDLLQQVLRQVPLRAARVLRQQGLLPLLQQLEDQGGRPQVPLDLIDCSYWVLY